MPLVERTKGRVGLIPSGWPSKRQTSLSVSPFHEGEGPDERWESTRLIFFGKDACLFVREPPALPAEWDA